MSGQAGDMQGGAGPRRGGRSDAGGVLRGLFDRRREWSVGGFELRKIQVIATIVLGGLVVG
ncbi:MAG: hypothetical protein IBJ11_12325, partial [Phycisphaerales bacterium]|nr:hypothetical protein [Phycisphaerales bacterium]